MVFNRSFILILLFVLGSAVYAQEESHETLIEQMALEERPLPSNELTSYVPGQKFNINRINAEELATLQILTPLQIESFFSYRNKYGDFISLMELQAIPLWDVQTIKNLMPLFFIRLEEPLAPQLKQRLKEGHHRLLLRMGSQPSLQGSLLNQTSQLLTYRFNFNNLLQLGFTTEKDAGEQRFPDHFSTYAAIRKKGMINNLVIGDFTVNMGQGLLHWQGYALGQSAQLISGFRQAALFKPHTGTDENRYHRGLAISLKKNKLEFSAFVSSQKIDASMQSDSTGIEQWASSVRTSGLHKTESERKGKNALGWQSTGGRMKINYGKGTFSVNFVGHHFNQPLKQSTAPYHAFAMRGKKFIMMSIDHSLFTPFGFFYGELAMQSNHALALVAGWMKSLDTKLDLSVSGRRIDRNYNSFQSNCISSSGEAEGEKGISITLNYHPVPQHQFEAFSDRYKRDAISYNTDGIQYGISNGLQYKWIINKKSEYYMRWSHRVKNGNSGMDGEKSNMLPFQTDAHWRSHFSSKINQQWTMRIRNEWSRIINPYQKKETGFLHYAEIIFKPMMKSFSFSLRGTFYETGGYASRIYAYERDLLGYYSVPGHSGTGSGYYVLLQQKWKHFTISGKMMYNKNETGQVFQWRTQIVWEP